MSEVRITYGAAPYEPVQMFGVNRTCRAKSVHPFIGERDQNEVCSSEKISLSGSVGISVDGNRRRWGVGNVGSECYCVCVRVALVSSVYTRVQWRVLKREF
jgi:hypothetical protein